MESSGPSSRGARSPPRPPHAWPARPVWHDGTVSFFLVFLAVVLVGAVFWAGLGWRARQSDARALPRLLDGGFEQPPANLPPVLLPARAAPEDVDRVRFSLGLRGYRMDQVDQVLDDLRDQLAAKQREIDELRAAVAAAQTPVQGGRGSSTAAGKDEL